MFELNVCIKEEMDEEVIRVMKESMDVTVTPLFALKSETCQCPGEHCAGCIEAEVSTELPQNGSSLVSGSGDECDNMPSDWFSGPTCDSEEATVDAEVAVSNDPIKEEHDEESLSILASTQPATPSIVVKDETCPCGEDCLACHQSDSDETIVVAPVNITAAPVSNSCTTTPARSHSCPECGKTFAFNAHLKIHLRVHTGERPYKCDICGKAFTQSGQLPVHLRTHTGDKPYKCDNCGKTFTTNGQLTLHYRRHTGDRPYKCSLCPKAFPSSSHAKYHQRTAHPIAH